MSTIYLDFDIDHGLKDFFFYFLFSDNFLVIIDRMPQIFGHFVFLFLKILEIQNPIIELRKIVLLFFKSKKLGLIYELGNYIPIYVLSYFQSLIMYVLILFNFY